MFFYDYYKIFKLMDKKECEHNNLEKINNNNIYICQDCSLIRMIRFNNKENDKYNSKLLQSKNN